MSDKIEKKYPGIFITFEGIDGAGKSSHIGWLAQLLRVHERTVIQSREPGGTSIGEQMRTILLSENMHVETETLLMFAARSEHLAQVIRPALSQGHIVISDRFSDATFAYQCGGRGLPEARFIALENWVHPDIQPDLTFLFDLPPKIAGERIVQQTRALDRFEQEHISFHERVRAAYLRRAQMTPERFHIIDANRSMSEIRQELYQETHSRITRCSNHCSMDLNQSGGDKP